MRTYPYRKTIAWLVVLTTLVMCLMTGCGQNPDASSNPQMSATSGVQPSSGASSTQPTTQTTAPTQPTTVPTQPTTVPTQPATQPTQPTEPEEPEVPNPIPEHLRNNYYFSHKGQGDCVEMTGTVMLVVVFVTDTISRWDEASMEASKKGFEDACDSLETAAAGYGAQLDMSITYMESKISKVFDVEHEELMVSAYSAMRKIGLGDAYYDQTILAQQYDVDSAPVLFVLNREGRAFAATMDAETDLLEFAVIYGPDLSSIRHELCHIFGALDFYFPQTTIDAMNRYFPDSIMYNHYKVVDDMTAFLIGWTDELSEAALGFLEATNNLTKEEIEEAQVQS